LDGTAVGDYDCNDQGQTDADFLVHAQFLEVMVSVTAVPVLLCHIVLWVWIGGYSVGWGLVSLLDLLKLSTILEHHIPHWSQYSQHDLSTYTFCVM
jgi:hypothetical protein